MATKNKFRTSKYVVFQYFVFKWHHWYKNGIKSVFFNSSQIKRQLFVFFKSLASTSLSVAFLSFEFVQLLAFVFLSALFRSLVLLVGFKLDYTTILNWLCTKWRETRFPDSIGFSFSRLAIPSLLRCLVSSYVLRIFRFNIFFSSFSHHKVKEWWTRDT